MRKNEKGFLLVNDEQLEQLRKEFLLEDHDRVVNSSSFPLSQLKTIKVGNNPGATPPNDGLSWVPRMNDFVGEEAVVGNIGIVDTIEQDGEKLHRIFFRLGKQFNAVLGTKVYLFHNFHPEWLNSPIVNRIIGVEPPETESQVGGLGSVAGISAAVLLGGALLKAKKNKAKVQQEHKVEKTEAVPIEV